MTIEEFIKYLDKAIDLLYEEKNVVANSEYDSTYREQQITKKEGAIEALSSLKYVLTH